ncbi:Predicted acylesterase/phospholipase RssA, contains patatin domain [Cyclobacterium lianum]|uniref:Predicted acylesterase/phospholipase RssA, contains patatin domain n=1 Tax=Cyclobacterium lianum TaxID=388280 RepID=A0A1M7QH45_9BACT|nr:patatin-like phospholipase family protein [Cyclobacterium lianum]SHN30325.1 Predicted acylesterase/phospholipase RssA, contains patatin domain [Cyclobacterium lianum]
MLIEHKDSEAGNRAALVLAGGGMRVAYQAGILKAMEEEGLRFAHVDGTSGGIFNAAMLASGHGTVHMMDVWKSLPVKYFASLANLKEYFTPWKLKGLGDADSIRRKVLPHFGVNVNTMHQLDLPVTFSLCNFTNKTVQAISAREIDERHLLAGVSLPILMPALKVGADWYIDAVWIKDANLMEAVRRGAEEIWLVWAIGNYPSYLNGALHQYVHSIEMSANGALWEEFQQIQLINRAIAHDDSPYGQRKTIKIHIIKPDFPLPLDPELFFGKITSRDLINMGYQDAKNYFLKQQSEAVKPDFHATKTPDAGDYLCLRLQYTGNLEFEKISGEVRYHVLLRFSSLEDRDRLDVFSSLYLDQYQREFQGGKHGVKITTRESVNLLEVTTTLHIDGREWLLTSKFFCKGPWYWFAGLDFKASDIILHPKNEANPEVAMQGRLHQSFGSRLRSTWTALARKQSGLRGGMAFKFKMVKKMIQYEV